MNKDLRHLLRAWGRRLLAVLDTWSVLVGLGLLPSAAALLALIGASVSADPVPYVALAFAILILGNLLLAAASLSLYHRYTAAAVVVDRIERWRTQIEIGVPDRWLPIPGDLSSLKFGQTDFEESYSQALTMGKERVGADVQLGLAFVGLVPTVTVFFDGVSQTADRSLVASIQADGGRLQQITRGIREIKEDPIPWRTDDGWIRLIQDSWLKERPFRGSVHMSPMQSYNVPYGEDASTWGAWFITYTAEHDGVAAPPRNYGLCDGALRPLD